ncbi:MAG TPA: hypothetical protein VHB78_09165 [Vicinamibacterales bacterium]|nr:hypothetical protein [Vicinamibacterales bacterium]
MTTRRRRIDKLRRDIEAKVDALDARIAETERVLIERRLAVEPADAPLLPVLRRRPKSPKKTVTGR